MHLVHVVFAIIVLCASVLIADTFLVPEPSSPDEMVYEAENTQISSSPMLIQSSVDFNVSVATSLKSQAKVAHLQQKEQKKMAKLKIAQDVAKGEAKQSQKDAFQAKLQALRANLKIKVDKAKQKMALKAKKMLASAEISRNQQETQQESKAKTTETKHKSKITVQLALAKLKNAVLIKSSAQEASSKATADQAFKLKKAKVRLEEKLGWKVEKTHKKIQAVRMRAKVSLVKTKEQTRKKVHLLRNPMGKKLQHLERVSARRVRAQNKHIRRHMRNLYRKKRKKIRAQRRAVNLHIQAQQQTTSKVMHQYAAKLGIKTEPTLHFKVSDHHKDLDGLEPSNVPEYRPPTPQTSPKVVPKVRTDRTSHSQQSKDHKAALTAMKTAMQALDPNPSS